LETQGEILMLRNSRLLLGLAALSLSFVLASCSLLPVRTSSTSSTLSPVEEAWGIISKDYVDQSKVDSTRLGRAAVKGMVDELNDPYTTYLDPDAYKLTITNQQGQFGGIGATVDARSNQIIIVAPIPGTPAEKAGIRPGDAILAVNGKSTEGLSVEEVVLLIRGPQGTSVTITVQHEGAASPVDLTITRAQIDVPSVSYEMKGTTAYFRIHFFSERTDEEMSPLIANLAKSGAKSIILDVRSNPGGPVDTVVNIASHFLSSGVVLYIDDNKGNEDTYNVKPATSRTKLPIVMLTDNYSASGSEVLAGALQDYGRAVVVGTKTFGKGSADRWYQLSDGSALYLTTSRWLTPKRRLIEGKGLDPDIPSVLKGDELLNWALDYLKNK
jgi:carboxyl-terminal processing protease